MLVVAGAQRGALVPSGACSDNRILDSFDSFRFSFMSAFYDYKNEDRLGPIGTDRDRSMGPIDGTDRWDPVSYVPPSQVSKKTPYWAFFWEGLRPPLAGGR